MSILALKNIGGGYDPGSQILKGIDLCVEPGQAVGIIGMNGCGKSTLGKAIVNTLPYRSGSVYFNGQDVSALPTHKLARRGISLFLQGGRVFSDLSVRDNLMIASGGEDIMEEVRGYFGFLKDRRSEISKLRADRLSGGERHQLALAICLLSNPRLLIVDEPSAGLSPAAVEELYEILGRIKAKNNIAIILIEQNIVKAAELCDRIELLESGEIIHTFHSPDINEIERIILEKYN